MARVGRRGTEEQAIIVNPHSVGLQHTDQPYRDDVPYPVAPDIELKPGMTITIDLPQSEVTRLLGIELGLDEIKRILESLDFQVEEAGPRFHGKGRGGRHCIWLATRRG